MAVASILSRCQDAAKGHEAEHGADARCLFHDVAEELKRLYAIERDVRGLLACGRNAQANTDPYQRHYDPIAQEYTSLDRLVTRRIEAGKRLLAAVKES